MSRYGVPYELALPPARAHEWVGRKAARSQDDATRLALCAVFRVLGEAGLATEQPAEPDPAVAVVASSALGNLQKVRDICAQVRAGGRREVSPLDAPGASSNVISSAVAIRFGCGGPNLTVCSGARGALDAIAIALLLLARGRAERVVVVGSEAAHPTACEFHACRSRQDSMFSLGTGAAALLLARPAAHGCATIAVPGEEPADTCWSSRPEDTHADDLRRELGDLFGAAGIVQVAVAHAALRARGAGSARVVCGDRLDGYSQVRLATT